MTIFNLKLTADEAVAMTDTLAVRRGRSPVRIHKVQDLPGAILTGAGANSVFQNFERLVRGRGYSGFDAIAADLERLAHDALAERVEALRGDNPGAPGVDDIIRGLRQVVRQGDPEGIAGGANYQLIVAGPSERLGRMAGAMIDFASGSVQPLEVPSFTGNDPDVCPAAAAQGVPSMQRQAEVLRAQYRSSVRWARESGFKGCEPEHVGGGDVEVTRIGMDRVIHRENLGPLVQQARSGKIGRNDPCPCGSGQKYKRCCLRAAA